MHWPIYLADFANSIKELMTGNAEQRFSTRDVLIVITASLAVGVVLVAWISIHHRRKTERDSSRRVLTDRPAPASSRKEHGERRRRRRRRRPHRPRNPSLHQTGGLPPPRTDDQPPKY